MELDAISQPELEQIERVGSADLVIGIFDLEHQENGSNAVAMKYTADFPQPVRCTHSTRARSTTTSRIASNCPARKAESSSPVSERSRSSASSSAVSHVVGNTFPSSHADRGPSATKAVCDSRLMGKPRATSR